jgi:hypothetical protein
MYFLLLVSQGRVDPANADKPHRGGLFIEIRGTTFSFFLFFGGAVMKR